MKESCHPLVSVIIPLFNKERYIGRCVSSILDQGLGEHGIEIVEEDDESTDSSMAECGEDFLLQSKCIIWTPRVHFFSWLLLVFCLKWLD